MQKTISTRIDGSILDMIEQIAIERKITKKRIIEEAVRNFWEKVHIEEDSDPLQASFGAWKRDEPTRETVKTARAAFNRSMLRHHIGKE